MNRVSHTGETIRVLIVDDHAVVRQGLKTFLELSNQEQTEGQRLLPIEIVGEAGNGREAAELARTAQPDIVLLDLVMPELDGIQALPLIREGSPASRILVLTSFAEDQRVLRAIQAGAYGYLLKDIAPRALAQAIRGAFAGDVQLHPLAAQQLMTAAAQARPAGEKPKADQAGLTERELDVARLIAAGLNNRSIAERLVVSEKTVKSHVGSILNKLNLEDRTQIAIYALRHGLVSDRD